jgi:simple sugar transport system permease protein
MGVAAAVLGSVALFVSGALAGLGGAVLLTGTPDYRISLGYSRNFGWDGLLVALLARDKPLLAIPMAFVFASLRTGSDYLGVTGVARDIVNVVQALLVLALLIPPAILFIRDRRRAIAATRSRT